MTNKIKVQTDKAPATGAGPYSQAIIANNFVFTQGSVYLTNEGKLLEGTIEDQIHQIMKNLQAILEGAGVGFESVVKTTIYMTDMSLYGTINEIYKSYFSDSYPAREAVCVKELPLGAKVEISMIAVKS